MKKSISLFLIFVIYIISFNFNSFASEVKLSSLSDEECVKFVLDEGVVIDERLLKYNEFPSFVKDIIIEVEKNPNYEFVFNNSRTLKIANEIKSVVREYYGVSDLTIESSSTSSSYQLLHSYVRNSSGNWVSSGGAWNNLYLNYNCYSYALGITSYFIDPGFSLELDGFIQDYTIEELARFIREDLYFYGYTNVEIMYYYTRYPNANETMICIRKGSMDYHVMKFNLSDYLWYHKPGNTAPLKYKYTVSDGNIWTNEYSKYGVEYSGMLTYNSDIIYIRYTH